MLEEKSLPVRRARRARRRRLPRQQEDLHHPVSWTPEAPPTLIEATPTFPLISDELLALSQDPSPRRLSSLCLSVYSASVEIKDFLRNRSFLGSELDEIVQKCERKFTDLQ